MSYTQAVAQNRRAKVDRNLHPHREARLAMLVWGQEYAAQRDGCMDFWDSLSDGRKMMVVEWADQLQACLRWTEGEETDV